MNSKSDSAGVVDPWAPWAGSPRSKPYQTPTPEEAVHRDGAVFVSQVAEAELTWLWPGRVPIGGVTVLIGDPGLGKSLVALDIAARVTRAAPWPDEPPIPQSELPDTPSAPQSPLPLSSSPSTLVAPTPGSVLLVNPEDRVAETIRPRLQALGADCSKVVVLPSLLDLVNPERMPGTLLDVAGDFFRAMRLLGALPNPRLMIIDPINAYFSGTEAQRVLLSLNEIAERRRVAVVIVGHLRKKAGTAVHRALGGLALVSVARAVWVVAKDPADERRRLMLPIKNNLAPDTGGLAYTIATSPSGEPIVAWSSERVELSADEVLDARGRGAPDDDRQYALQWLATRLAHGPSPTRQVLEDARAHAIAPRTLRRAFRDLNGEAVRIGSPSPGHWAWRLPE
jgi:hypothetical protein